MAIYHLSAQTISRGCGRSSVAAAAYRAAEKILDVRTGFTHDFRAKEADVFFKAILLPKGAPQNYKNRDELWNAVEAIEKRKDAQLAREFNIALPRELTEKESIALIEDFVKEAFVDKGMIADVTCHRGEDKITSERQPHAHVMLTMREVTPDGFGLKVRAWNQKALLLEWRELWAEKANHHLHLAGIQQKIDHRSYLEQGIDLIPQTKIGPKDATYHQERQAQHQAIARANGERLLEDPSIAWKALTQHQSSFTQKDLARFVHRHTADREQFNRVYQPLLASEELVPLNQCDKGDAARFTTQPLLDIECDLMDRVGELAQEGGFNVKQKTFRTLYPDYQEKLTPTQTQALAHVLKPERISCITGLAGTGKSYLLKMAHETWKETGYTVKGATLSGIAAENLEEASGIPSQTAASFLRQLDHPKLPTPLDNQSILVLDEAGMLDLPQMGKLIAAVDRSGAKAVILQDPEQLPAIGPGAPARAIAEQVGFVALTDIQRQNLKWQKEATYQLGTQQTKEALDAYAAHGHVHPFQTQVEAKQGMVDHWAKVIEKQPLDQVLMLAYTRKDVKELNDAARDVLIEKGQLGQAKTIETDSGALAFALGDRVYFGRNEYHELKVKNGSVGQVTGFTDQGLSIELDKDGRTVEVNSETYPYLNHGYATTIYKSQGKTVDRTFVLTSTHLNRHSTYVALSRHRQMAEIFYSKETFMNEACLTDHLSRDGQKINILEHVVPGSSLEIDTSIQNSLQEIDALSAVYLDDGTMDNTYQDFHEKTMESHAAAMEKLDTYVDDFMEKDLARTTEMKQEMLDYLPIAEKAAMLKSDYLSLAQAVDRIEQGDQSHPLFQKIQDMCKNYREVMRYWQAHDEKFMSQIDHVREQATYEEPEITYDEPELCLTHNRTIMRER